MLPFVLPLLATVLGAGAVSADAIQGDALPIAASTYHFVPGTTTTVQALDNGLTVVVTEDTSAAVGQVTAWVPLGSGDETPGREGAARLVAGLLFEPLKPEGPGFLAQCRAFQAEARGRLGTARLLLTAQLPSEALVRYLSADARRLQLLRVDADAVDRECRILAQGPGPDWDSGTDSGTRDLGATVARLDRHPGVTAQECDRLLDARVCANLSALFVDGAWSRTEVLQRVRTAYGTWKRAPGLLTPTSTAQAPLSLDTAAVPAGSGASRFALGLHTEGQELGPGGAGDLLLHLLFRSATAPLLPSALAKDPLLRPHPTTSWDEDGPWIWVELDTDGSTEPAAVRTEVQGLAETVANLPADRFADYEREWILQRRDALARPEGLNAWLARAWSSGSLDRFAAALEGQDLPDQAGVSGAARRLLAAAQVRIWSRPAAREEVP